MKRSTEKYNRGRFLQENITLHGVNVVKELKTFYKAGLVKPDVF